MKNYKFKASFMKSTFIASGLSNWFFNGLFYYLLSSGVEKGIIDYAINGGATALILSLICGGLALPGVKGNLKKGLVPDGVWDREHLIGHCAPKGGFMQVLLASILVTIVFTPICAGIFALWACFNAATTFALPLAQVTMPVLTGAILHGFAACFMALMVTYLVNVFAVVTYQEANSKGPKYLKIARK